MILIPPGSGIFFVIMQPYNLFAFCFTVKRDSNNAIIGFSIGKGDCPAGCLYREQWVFEITNNRVHFPRSFENNMNLLN